MAEIKDDIDVTEARSGLSKKLILIIAAVVIVIMIGVVTMLMTGGERDSEQASEAASEQEVSVPKSPPIYFSVETPFVVNFSEQSQGKVRYLQVKLKIMARDHDVIDAFKLHLPAIQHELLLLFHSQKYDDLNTSGTKDLQQAVLDKINAILKKEKLQHQLEAVYFTSFLMQ